MADPEEGRGHALIADPEKLRAYIEKEVGIIPDDLFSTIPTGRHFIFVTCPPDEMVGGLHLPKVAQREKFVGYIIGIGPGFGHPRFDDPGLTWVWSDEQTIGAKVMISKTGSWGLRVRRGDEMEWGDQPDTSFLMDDERNILAMVEPPPFPMFG